MAVDTSSAAGIWQEALRRIEGRLSKPTYELYLKNMTPLGVHGDTLVFSVPSRHAKEWIESRHAALIHSALQEVLARTITIQLTVVEDAPPAPAPTAPARGPEGLPLSPKYTFDTFVIGTGNRFAHAAAMAVAEAPARAYNPLFIYGGVGLGKTHLLQAIGHHVIHSQQLHRVAYISSEKFTNELINAIRDDRTLEFRTKYRSVDVLLIDDIQFLAGKERTQEEFFHTFNTLHEASRQIIITSDRPPKEIPTLEDRLRSRFEWGLIADIQPPDLETRIAILRKKAEMDHLTVGEDVLTYIASRVTTNIRELEGALTRVVAFCSLTGRPMNEELAQDVLKDVFPQGELPQVTIERIQEIISGRFGLSLDELCGDRRSQNIVYPRQVAMYLSRELTDSSLPKIGKQFGGRDHTTVIHATSKIARLIREDRSVYNLVQELTARVKQVP